MMRDRNDARSIREDLERWRDTLKNAFDPDARRAVRELIEGAERRLAEIERRVKTG